ncbi:MAG: Uncharacterised protein [Cryomorphaceae bacterium]|nr:MAG: Uncharacterised protein [Cryomorphaceae bacterium]
MASIMNIIAHLWCYIVESTDGNDQFALIGIVY